MENIPETIALQLDLSGMEILVVTMLANLGSCVLAGDRESAKVLGEMLVKMDHAEAIAVSVLDKLESSLKLAKQMSQLPEM